nr:uncharacterized protein LOC112275781 isoform X2 [Physcomitrium patens]|eukprot:XP_024362180.1 uncharacterized protein LOC112275781 isoform X2 [Physcomitrella patens]
MILLLRQEPTRTSPSLRLLRKRTASMVTSQEDNHRAGTIGDVHDNPASIYTDVDISVAGATDGTRSASGTMSTEQTRSERWFENNFVLIMVSTLLQIGLGIMLLFLLWRLDLRPLKIVVVVTVLLSAIVTIAYIGEYEWQRAGIT